MRVDVHRNHGKRECPSCATEVEFNNNYCPICGYAFPHPTPRQRGLKLAGAVIMLAILAWVLLR